MTTIGESQNSWTEYDMRWEEYDYWDISWCSVCYPSLKTALSNSVYVPTTFPLSGCNNWVHSHPQLKIVGRVDSIFAKVRRNEPDIVTDWKFTNTARKKILAGMLNYSSKYSNTLIPPKN